MKALSILGTSSNAGKSWVATALCAWLRRQGVRVAPFKAQNMANNSFATVTGGEMGIAQAVQAEACGLVPTVEMNPILLKPNGIEGSQIVRLGVAGETRSAASYYDSVEETWKLVSGTLDSWENKCDVLLMEGAGSPVELNLLHRDIVNLRPIEHLNGRWLLVANIEYGGVFAQVLGTWGLMPERIKERGLGTIVNRFRGSLELFSEAGSEFEKRMTLPYLGCLPYDARLRIDDEDSLNAIPKKPRSDSPYVAWIKYPQVSNTQDERPWEDDEGIQSVWTTDSQVVLGASAVVLPGSKNTLSDLKWLKEMGLALAVLKVVERNTPVVGVCGGLQMLGEWLSDADGDQCIPGLGLLPIETQFMDSKRVLQNQCRYGSSVWQSYEIRTGVTKVLSGKPYSPLLRCWPIGGGAEEPEGFEKGAVWGTYQHGVFDSPNMRKRLLDKAGIDGATVFTGDRIGDRLKIYDAMADHLDHYLDLRSVKEYLGL